MTDNVRPSDHDPSRELEDLVGDADDIARAFSDLASMANTLGRAGNRVAHAIMRHRQERGRAGTGGRSAEQLDAADRAQSWYVRVLNATEDAACVAMAVPDSAGELKVLGWRTVLPGRESFYRIDANPFGQLGLMACATADARDFFAGEACRFPVAVPVSGAIPDKMRFQLSGWSGGTDPSICSVSGPASRLVDVGCVMGMVAATGTIAFEIPEQRHTARHALSDGARSA